MLVVLLSVGWVGKTFMFQLSGFYCRSYSHALGPKVGKIYMPGVLREGMSTWMLPDGPLVQKLRVDVHHQAIRIAAGPLGT